MEKTFLWEKALRDHPIFSDLSDHDINELLKESSSKERKFFQNDIIIREGEENNTIFFIGSGSVQVVLQDEKSNTIALALLRRGEVFGEMALLEQKPRSATVIGKEDGIVLEIKGSVFSSLLKDHPEILLKILTIFSKRIRHTNDEILSNKMKEVDEKINLLNAKLDAELRAVDASLEASQAVFDQTRIRADEVITNAERSRSHLQSTATVISSIITIAALIFGALGILKLQRIDDIKDEAVAIKHEIIKEAGEVAPILASLKDAVKDAQEGNKWFIDEGNKILQKRLWSSIFRKYLEEKNIEDAIQTYYELRFIDTNHPNLRLFLLSEIRDILSQQFREQQEYGDYTKILCDIMLDSNIQRGQENSKLQASFLLLANAILIDATKFCNPLKTFRQAYTDFKYFLHNTPYNPDAGRLDISSLKDILGQKEFSTENQAFSAFLQDLKKLDPEI